MHFCFSVLIDSAATEIDLSYNLIETISAGTFSNSVHCEILTLNYNSINTIEANAFQVKTQSDLRLVQTFFAKLIVVTVEFPNLGLHFVWNSEFWVYFIPLFSFKF